MTRSLANTAVSNDAITVSKAGAVAVNGVQLVKRPEAEIVRNVLGPWHVLCGRDMTGAQGTLVGVGRCGGAVAGIFLWAPHVDQRIAEVGEHVIFVGPDGRVIPCNDGVIDRWRGFAVGRVCPALGFPLRASAIQETDVVVPEQAEYPECVRGPPVVFVSIDHDRCIASDALAAEELRKALTIDVIALDGVVEVGVPVDLDRALDVSGLVEQYVFIRLDDHEAWRADVRRQPVRSDEALRMGVACESCILVWCDGHCCLSRKCVNVLGLGLSPDLSIRIYESARPFAWGDRKSSTHTEGLPMTAVSPRSTGALADRNPTLSGEEIVAHLVPPRQFSSAMLESYRPDRDYPSQGAALAAIRTFESGFVTSKSGLFGRKKSSDVPPGIYLDGGFGVGKTHLLAALWHAAPGRKYFGTFIEFTALVGALGYQPTVALLKGASLVCIDEFELDDPGDTRLMSRLLSDLVASGTRLAATSNTPPNALGEGRFAAQDFLREIDALAAKFRIVRIDGLDYRRRDIEGHAVSLSDADFDAGIAAADGVVTVDTFDSVAATLSKVHPSRYVRLVEDIDTVGIRDVHPFVNQTDALRFVALVDRLYDGQVRVLATGTQLDQVFPAEMLAGGYQKKYLRANSRLIALTTGSGL
jgi:cell division protein ZapE